MELILAAAFKAVMGVISGPVVPLLKYSIDQSIFLEFFTAQLVIAQPRDDYRELIEFSVRFSQKISTSRVSLPGTRTNALWSLDE